MKPEVDTHTSQICTKALAHVVQRSPQSNIYIPEDTKTMYSCLDSVTVTDGLTRSEHVLHTLEAYDAHTWDGLPLSP
jgi:hypothetical protein